MKRLLSLAMAAAMVLSLVACGSKNNGNSSTDMSTSGSGTNASQDTDNEITGLTEAIAEPPILLTSGGQSADYAMVGSVMTKLGMDVTSEATVKADALGDAKTLVVVVGGSSKGLGAAGIDADGELARLDAVLTAAEDAGMTIIVMHTGGTARRGDLSDKFITPVFTRADYAIVVEAGDADGMMQGICADNGIPMDLLSSIGEVAEVLPKAFK